MSGPQAYSSMNLCRETLTKLQAAAIIKAPWNCQVPHLPDQLLSSTLRLVEEKQKAEAEAEQRVVAPHDLQAVQIT